ncbi:MAG TPA: hypothetical protein VFV52_12575 [Bacilli bacterium]|nr:hypothetical protein [Bacilli bacterium]
MSKGMFGALLVSILLALVLSLLPDQALDRWGGKVHGSQQAGDVPVTKMDGVVDQLGALSLQGRLRKVEYEQDRLTVWLAVSSARLQQDQPWSDAYKIAYRFLVETPHLREVEVKLVTTERPDVVAMTVRADGRKMQGAPQPSSTSVPTFVQQNLEVVSGR